MKKNQCIVCVHKHKCMDPERGRFCPKLDMICMCGFAMEKKLIYNEHNFFALFKCKSCGLHMALPLTKWGKEFIARFPNFKPGE